MSTIRIWSIIAMIATVAVVAIGWFLGVAPRIADARTANQERANVVVLNQAQQQRLDDLEKLSADKPALERELAVLRQALPTDAALPDLIGQLSRIADGAGAQLVGFTASEPAVFEAQPVDGAAAAPAPATQPAAAGAPAAVGAGFLSIPVTVQAAGSQAQLLEFVRALQYGERLFLVTGLVITVDEVGASASIDGLVYVMQQPAAALPVTTGAAPAAPAATP